MSEAQKYQGALYKEKKPKGQQNKPAATTPRPSSISKHAYVEDAAEFTGRPHFLHRR